jgi:hypothetical protein
MWGQPESRRTHLAPFFPNVTTFSMNIEHLAQGLPDLRDMKRLPLAAL